jgi:hypothetical protein
MLKIILFLFLILLIVILCSSKKSVSSIKLDQPNNFYKQKRNATLTYLNAVYPQGKDSFNKLNDLELAYFYNSLWFYYNCSYQYSDNDLGSFTGDNKDTKWDPLPCATKYPLPYPPQGIFYNFWTYNKFNMPTIYSDSDESKEYLQLSLFMMGGFFLNLVCIHRTVV